MDRLDLIKRNVQEIVTEGELEELLNKKKLHVPTSDTNLVEKSIWVMFLQ